MNMHDRMMNGLLFTDMCESLPEDRNRAKKRMIAFNSTTPDNLNERLRIQSDMLNDKSGKAWIEPPFYFCYGKHIILGEGTHVDFNCSFVDDGMITVGKNVIIGPSVSIVTVGHPIRPDMREYMYTDPVTICDNAWIGANVTILPGVTIGENSVIGAGSVVTEDIPANVFAAGNPCSVIREISDQDNEFYYKDRRIDEADLEEEKKLREQNKNTLSNVPKNKPASSSNSAFGVIRANNQQQASRPSGSSYRPMGLTRKNNLEPPKPKTDEDPYKAIGLSTPTTFIPKDLGGSPFKPAAGNEPEPEVKEEIKAEEPVKAVRKVRSSDFPRRFSGSARPRNKTAEETEEPKPAEAVEEPVIEEPVQEVIPQSEPELTAARKKSPFQ